jgi:hypothetical protein
VNPARPPGDTLVGAAIALESTRGTFAERWAAVFGFRDQNAGWGLVALDQGVARAALLATMDGAVSRAPAQFAAGPPSRLPTSLNPPSSGVSTTLAPRTTTTVARVQPGVTTTTTAPPPSGGTSTTIVGPINTGTPLDATLNSLVNTLTGLLNSLSGK